MPVSSSVESATAAAATAAAPAPATAAAPAASWLGLGRSIINTLYMQSEQCPNTTTQNLTKN